MFLALFSENSPEKNQEGDERHRQKRPEPNRRHALEEV